MSESEAALDLVQGRTILKSDMIEGRRYSAWGPNMASVELVHAARALHKVSKNHSGRLCYIQVIHICKHSNCKLIART